MTKNYSVVDVRPSGQSAIDIKSFGLSVEDTRPKNLGLGEMDDVVVYLGAGQSIGPGWYMYVTYPTTISINP